MPDTILFVDAAAEAHDLIARLFRTEFEVVTARSAEDALDLCRLQGPFAIVVSDHELPGLRGGEFLARIHEGWPDSVTMLLTGCGGLDVAIEALHAGRIFRFLEKPCPREVLAAALRDGLAEFRARRAAHTRAGKLGFSCRALADFNGELEHRIGEQAQALLRLHRFVSELNACDSVVQIAEAAADAASDVSGGSACEVELAQRGDGSQSVVARCGGALGDVSGCWSIVAAEGELGALRVAHGGPLAQAQRDMLASIAASVAVAARNAIQRRERDDAQLSTIHALAKLAEQRDNETGRHLERVSAYARLIAVGLREDGWYRELLTDEWVAELARSAPLHDIGKVGIPDAILLKPGKLTPEEWHVMKRHAEIGAETLRSVMSSSSPQPFLQMSLEIAWCHHEKWDGAGYPRGLAGESIPLAARILALADVYDALTSERPYKHAWSHAEAFEWILKGSGSHFDPRVVDAFARRVEQADAIRTRLADTPADLAKLGIALAA